ncbi:MAG: photosynthetic reaction center cytochrome c subunit family protein [Vicinamibacterales bacterium]
MYPVRVLTLAGLVALAGAGWQSQSRPADRAAEEAYKNIQVLTGQPASVVEPIMKSFTKALGVECGHCHVVDEWDRDTKPAKTVARQMLRMVDVLDTGALRDTSGVACLTCHGGRTVPARLPREDWEGLVDRWPASAASADEPARIRMAVYAASLGVGCEHCHVPDRWTDDSKPAFRLTSTMTGLFEVFPKYMPASARTQCYMCHKGSTSPQR